MAKQPDDLSLGPTPASSDPNRTDGSPDETRAFSSVDLTAEQARAAAASSPFVAPSANSSWVGRKIGHYEIIGLLGSGAMGVVYRAHDTVIDRQVAIKVLPEDAAKNETLAKRFLAEAKATGRLNHANVVQIYEVGEASSTHYLVMELVEGGSITDQFKENKRLSVLQATMATADAAKGLAAAHAAGLLHRDIKPANLLLAADSTVKVTDFGLAKFSASTHGAATQAGQVIGTPYFMSPEQCEGRPVDERSDVYSLGATYYSLLTGKNPYEESGSVVRVLYAHVHGAPLDPSQVRADVPPACAAIVQRATAKLPEDRYASMEEMIADLNAVIATLSGTQILLPSQSGVRTLAGASGVSPATKAALAGGGFISRRKWLIGAGGAALAAAGLGGFFAIRGGGEGGNPSRPPLGNSQTPATVPPVVAAPSGEPIKVGILHSLTGTLAQSSEPVVNAILLAIEELNAAGGVLGRPVESVIRDCGSEPANFPSAAESLITEEKVCTIFGCWTSAARRSVVPTIEKHNHLLIYSIQFEGLEDSPNLVYTGATPNQQIIPAVRWAFAFDRRHKFYLVGSDYVFPRAANVIIRDALGELGGEVVGEAYRPLGDVEFLDIIADIQRVQPDAILNTINGDSNVAFFRELRRAGVTPRDIPTISFSIGEAELRHFKMKEMEGDLAAWNYFQSVSSPENTAFIAAYRKRFGSYLSINDPMESSYVAVKLWAKAVEASQSLDPVKIRAAMAGVSTTGPGGLVEIDAETFYTKKTPRVGRIQADGQFKTIWTGADHELPLPYPPAKTKAEWDKYLAQLYADWGNQWGAPVE